jgi:hypothetical protein
MANVAPSAERLGCFANHALAHFKMNVAKTYLIQEIPIDFHSIRTDDLVVVTARSKSPATCQVRSASPLCVRPIIDI